MRRLCFNPLFVYYYMWLIVTLWALIYRWAGGSAEKDIHKMDQFPLGKGKSVWLIPTATASIVLSLYTNTGAGVCRLKTSPSHCFFRFQTRCSSMLHVTLLHFQNTVPSWSWDWLWRLRPHTQSFFLACLSYSFSFVQSHIACSKDLLSLQLLLSHYSIVQYIFFFSPCELLSVI